MHSENNPMLWSMIIPATGRGATGAVALGWCMLLVAALWVASTPGMTRNFTVLAVGFGFFGLIVVATVNACLIKVGKRGGLTLDIDGFSIQRGWRADTRYLWGDVATFDTLLVSPNDGSSRLSVGFYRKSGNETPGTFVSFPETLAIPPDKLVSLLEYIRAMPVAEREILPNDIHTLVRLMPSDKPSSRQSTYK